MHQAAQAFFSERNCQKCLSTLVPSFLYLPQKQCNLILAPVHILFQQVYDFFVEAFLVPTLKPLSARFAAAQNCPVLSGFHTHGSTGTTKRCL